MFRRIDFEMWHAMLPVASFIFFSSIFLLVLVAAWRMKERHVERMSRMPLEDEKSQ